MNRTEHRLRIAFDPEYEAKWREVEEDRRLVRKVTIKMMRSKSLIFLSFWCGTATYVLSQSWPASFITPVLLWMVESTAYMWIADREKRKELGI